MDHPGYRNMHSYPNQSHYSHHLYPGTQHHIPNQMYMNPIQPPVNYGYVPPVPCLGCCNWGSSPCSHHIPHCFGNYHSFPPQYMPCFPNGPLPRYEFEKNVPATRGQHCCGCPNHSIVWKDNDNADNNQVVWKDGAKNGLYPLDLSDLVSSKKQTVGEEMDDGEGRRFPFPICWMPCEPKGNEKEMEKQHLIAKPSLEPETSPRVKKIIEVKEVEKHKEDEGSKNQKTIEVKEVEKHKEDEGSKYEERGSDGGKMDKGENKLSKESVKRKNPSPSKPAKLPPVCLRVDPLPKRKAAKGSSQSPNPPSDKQKPGLPLENILPNEVKEGNVMKTIKVFDGKTHQEKNTGEKVEIRVDAKVESNTRENIENDGMKGQSEEFGDSMGKNEGTEETSKRSLSEEEAALIIQSAYRGFDTRRWDPVKKLKEIAEVRDQIDGVKHMIQAMESCSDIEGSSKQRNVISETIMSLLLKLDTIQGLHPSIRKIRKAVVQDLVSLQEKLASTVIEKLENSPQQEPNMSCEEDASNKIEDATKSKNDIENLSDLPEVADQNQPVGAFNCANLEIPVDNEVPMDCLEKEDEKSSEGLESDKTSAKNNEGELVLEQTYKVPILPDTSIKVTEIAPSDRGELDSELTDHPKEERIETKSDMDSLNTGKAIDNPLEKDMFCQLLQEGVSERDTAEETKTAEKEPKNDTTGCCAENHEAYEEKESPDVRIDVRTEMEKGEDNSKLIEENERLRGTVENLVKLGQEQLTAISSLTARVMNLERKLSNKKKKLKVKQRKGSKNGALLISDGYC